MPSDLRCELVCGELIHLPWNTAEQGVVAASIAQLVAEAARVAKGGQTYAAGTGFHIEHDPDSVIAPDCSFVRTDRLIDIEHGFFPGPPDLAIEVVSPNETREGALDRVQMWLDAGTPLVWVAWPPTRSVTVHRLGGGKAEVLHEGDRLNGGDVLPGFECDVAEVFA